MKSIQLESGRSVFDFLMPGGTSTPHPLAPYYYQDPISVDRELVNSLHSNWGDEIAAFAEFHRTRTLRKIQRIPVVAALSVAADTPWRWVRIGSKGLMRLVPVIGWGLLAYDLYVLGDDLDLY